ncbi:glycine cleavage system aminomethyltransferase GcvT [Candidatus Peregrinibacteria bacterium]|nr:glycine cleavage system aminomethyltransferase GcvT [Candidatus Peregrinibacteria bacterium]
MLLATPLNDMHKKMGARMVDFGGWDMPVIYTNQIEEHHAVRKAAGIFDVSHMGEIMIEGKNAFHLVQKLVSKNIEHMENGKVILGVMCNEKGGIIDDLTVYKYHDEKYLLVVNAGTAIGDYEWALKHAQEFEDVRVTNVSDDTAKIDLQGPKAQEILQKLTKSDLSEIKRYCFVEIEVAEIPMTISRSGYTGEDGFELYFAKEHAKKIWDALLEAGKDMGLLPCGLGSRDTLRTECGMMLYGHDIDDEHTPLEAVYGWAVSFEKDFIGKKALIRQKEEGLKRKLVGFEMIERGIARDHYPIFKNGENVGNVTSGTPSPTLGKNIGMGYIRSDLKAPGTEIEIQIRNNFVKAKVVELPFYTPAYRRK